MYTSRWETRYMIQWEEKNVNSLRTETESSVCLKSKRIQKSRIIPSFLKTQNHSDSVAHVDVKGLETVMKRSRGHPADRLHLKITKIHTQWNWATVNPHFCSLPPTYWGLFSHNFVCLSPKTRPHLTFSWHVTCNSDNFTVTRLWQCCCSPVATQWPGERSLVTHPASSVSPV